MTGKTRTLVERTCRMCRKGSVTYTIVGTDRLTVTADCTNCGFPDCKRHGTVTIHGDPRDLVVPD